MAGAVRRRIICRSLAKKSGDHFPRPGIVGAENQRIAMIIFRLNCRFRGCDCNEAQLLQNKTRSRDSAPEQLQN